MSGVAKVLEHELLFAGPHPRPVVKKQSIFKVQALADGAFLKKARSLFVMCAASHLQDVAAVVSAANKRHHLRLLLVFSDTDATWLPQILDRADLRAIRNMVVHNDVGLGSRILRAWENDAQDALVARAVALEDDLLVITCAGERLEIPFDQVPALRRLSKEERPRLLVSPDGSYIHWPKPDIHLDIDAIRARLDPEWAAQATLRKLEHDGNLGGALRALRESAGLTQSQIPGLSERQARRTEKGESISSASLRCYAQGLALELGDLLARLASQMRLLNVGVPDGA